jgi:hypothetical protein
MKREDFENACKLDRVLVTLYEEKKLIDEENERKALQEKDKADKQRDEIIEYAVNRTKSILRKKSLYEMATNVYGDLNTGERYYSPYKMPLGMMINRVYNNYELDSGEESLEVKRQIKEQLDRIIDKESSLSVNAECYIECTELTQGLVHKVFNTLHKNKHKELIYKLRLTGQEADLLFETIQLNKV